MSDNPDFPMANHALQVLRQARLSRNEVAALKLWDLAHAMADIGLRTPEVEQAHQTALVAVSALAKSLEQEGFAPPALWKAAFGATETWRELLD
jgi:hypothetical protein